MNLCPSSHGIISNIWPLPWVCQHCPLGIWPSRCASAICSGYFCQSRNAHLWKIQFFFHLAHQNMFDAIARSVESCLYMTTTHICFQIKPCFSRFANSCDVFSFTTSGGCSCVGKRKMAYANSSSFIQRRVVPQEQQTGAFKTGNIYLLFIKHRSCPKM